MTSKSPDAALKKLVESNVKTQESVSAVVSSVKELVSELRKAAEEGDEELKFTDADGMKAISAKLDTIIKQNERLMKLMNEMAIWLKRSSSQQTQGLPGLPPIPPPPPGIGEYKRL